MATLHPSMSKEQLDLFLQQAFGVPENPWEVLEVFDAIFSTAETTFLDHCVFLYNKSDGQFFGRKKAEVPLRFARPMLGAGLCTPKTS